jgi:hypothetical protein
MEHYSVDTIEAVKDLRDARSKAQKNITACQKKLDQCPGSPQLPKLSAEIDPYVIEVDFDAISDPAKRNYFLSLPTSFALEKDQVQSLIDVGPQLLNESQDFKAFLESLTLP